MVNIKKETIGTVEQPQLIEMIEQSIGYKIGGLKVDIQVIGDATAANPEYMIRTLTFTIDETQKVTAT